MKGQGKKQEKLKFSDVGELQSDVLSSNLVKLFISNFQTFQNSINKLEQLMKKSFREREIAIIKKTPDLFKKRNCEKSTEENLKSKSIPSQDAMILNGDEKYKTFNGLNLNKTTSYKKIVRFYVTKFSLIFPQKDELFEKNLNFNDTFFE